MNVNSFVSIYYCRISPRMPFICFSATFALRISCACVCKRAHAYTNSSTALNGSFLPSLSHNEMARLFMRMYACVYTVHICLSANNANCLLFIQLNKQAKYTHVMYYCANCERAQRRRESIRGEASKKWLCHIWELGCDSNAIVIAFL